MELGIGDYLQYIYLDESGNLGFTPKSGEYFIVAALCCKTEKDVNRCIKNARTGLGKKYKSVEMKSSNSSDATKRRVLECIAKRDVSIAYIALKKDWVHSHLREKKNVIHSYAFGQLLTNTMRCYEPTKTKIVIDKFLNYDQIEEFNKCISLKIPYDADIEHVSSKANDGIKAVDFVAGAINRKYWHDDETFYKIISSKVNMALDSREEIFKRV